MTVALLAAGGLVAALGTRACALLFVAAAVLGAREPQAGIAALSVWTAAAAAGWVLLERSSPRSVAIPALGAAAVLAGVGSPNGAVVLGLWVIGTAAAVMTRTPTPAGRRWALALAPSDLIVAVAIAGTAGRGFEGWPATLRLPGAIALLAAAVLRAPLAGGSSASPAKSEGSGSYPAVLIVRAQTVALLGLAAAAADRSTLNAMVVAGAVGFALATTASRRSVVDATQELALVAMAIGGSALGWGPNGWVWGALAAGTLTHYLRFTLGSRPSGALADAVERAAGLGLPFLPVLVALLEGALRRSSWLGLVVVFGALGGIAGRTRMPPVAVRRDGALLDPVRAYVPLAAAVVASLVGPLLSSPRPASGGEASWPGAWAAAVIAFAALAGSQIRHAVTVPARRPRVQPPWAKGMAAFSDRVGAVDRFTNDVAVWMPVAAVGAAAVALWLVGLGRGFL